MQRIAHLSSVHIMVIMYQTALLRRNEIELEENARTSRTHSDDFVVRRTLPHQAYIGLTP